MVKREQFKVGDAVTWKSQSQGSWATKSGTVADVIAPWVRPDRQKWPSLYRGAGCGNARNHESYIVNANGLTYWPTVSKLSREEA